MSKVLVVLMALAAPPVNAGQIKVTLEKVTVKPIKADGRPWDGEGSPPDVAGTFQVGALVGNECKGAKSESIAKHQDTLVFEPRTAVVLDVALTPLCAIVSLQDRDVLAPDPIGMAASRLQSGINEITVGQAVVVVSVTEVVADGDAGQAPMPQGRPPSTDRLVRLTVVGAKIAATRSDGATWDEAVDPSAEQSHQAKVLFEIGLAIASSGTSSVLSGIRSALGDDHARRTVSHTALTTQAPDARLRISWGNVAYETSASLNTYMPDWDMSFVVPESLLTRPARVEVVDVDGELTEPIGVNLFTGQEVAGSPIARLTVGAATDVLLQVEHVHETRAPEVKAFQITTADGWQDTGVFVVGGQTAVVTAVGEHCLRGGRCFTADGNPKTLAYPPTDGLPEVQEGELVVVLGDRVYPVGTHGSFTAHTSGTLLIGVASKSMASGSLAAKIAVFYPLAVDTASPTGRSDAASPELPANFSASPESAPHDE